MNRVFVVLFSLVLLRQPIPSSEAKTLPSWTLKVLVSEAVPIIIEEIHQVEDENGIYNGDELSDPHYLRFNNEGFLIGNNPDYYYNENNNNGNVDRLPHYVSGMSYKNGFDTGVTLNHESCKDIVNIQSDKSTTGYHHAATLPFGSPDRVGNDRIYGGYFAFQGDHEGGAEYHGWYGCTIGYSNLSSNEGKLAITPANENMFNEMCEEKHLDAYSGKEPKNLSYYHVFETKCTDKGTLVRQEYHWEPTKMKTSAYPAVGSLESCVSTDGNYDYIAGGINIRGENIRNMTVVDRSNGSYETYELETPVESFGSSCFIKDDSLILVGGFNSCPSYKELLMETHDKLSSLLISEVRGLAFGGGCLAYITEGYTTQQGQIIKYPWVDEYNPPFAFPERIDAYGCADTFIIDLISHNVTKQPASTQFNCQAFSTDILVNGSLIRFGGLSAQGKTLDEITHNNFNSSASEQSVGFEKLGDMYIERINPLVRVLDEGIEISCGGSMEHPSGFQCRHIDVFTAEGEHIVNIQENPPQDQDAPGFGFIVTFTAVCIAAISCRKNHQPL